MNRVDKTQNRTLRGDVPRSFLKYGLAFALFALMMVTVVDVIGRDLFNNPLRGGYELSGLMLMALFFVALPVATAKGDHITVELVDTVLSPRGLRLLKALVSLAAAVVVGVVAYYVVLKGLSSMRYREATMLLRIPLGPFALGAALSLALTSLILAWRSVAALRGSTAKMEDDNA